MRTRTLLFIMIVAVAVGIAAYVWSESDRSLANANDLPVKESITASALLDAFTLDETVANARFVGAEEQVIQVSGTIRAMEPVDEGDTNLILETGNDLAGVVCEFANDDLDPNWRSGANVRVNGFCTGLLLDVVLVRCTAAPSK
ncbi:MAG: hypothetical protein IPO56_00040 [Flavobacteriales bacterium]|nr:hypothetical protein [Flavobacteriales bacterium]